MRTTSIGHKNKHIRAAIKAAVAAGWTFKPSKRGHAYGVLLCTACGECRVTVFSTPAKPEDHAKDIAREVGKCAGA